MIMYISACIKTYFWFFSNVVFLNNVYSPQPPSPFPEGEGGESGDSVPAAPSNGNGALRAPRPAVWAAATANLSIVATRKSGVQVGLGKERMISLKWLSDITEYCTLSTVN